MFRGLMVQRPCGGWAVVFLGVGHQNLCREPFLGGKYWQSCGFHLVRRQGSSFYISVGGTTSFLCNQGLWILGLPVGRGEIPFTLVAELPGAPATLQF